MGVSEEKLKGKRDRAEVVVCEKCHYRKLIRYLILNKDISWHWFRPSCASHSLKNGAFLESVRKKLGHSNISITNTYLHDDEDAT